MARNERSSGRCTAKLFAAIALAVVASGCAGVPGDGGRAERITIGYGLDGDRTLLLRPVDGGRLSSTFGPREHPILERRMMHRGIDYAAPTVATCASATTTPSRRRTLISPITPTAWRGAGASPRAR